MIRALVVDDQPLARDRLVTLLTAEPDVQVVGTAASGTDAIDAITALNPDLVFLDLQMPEVDGFEVIERIGVERMPMTIFVTAYDEYAVRAFEVHALDYLLKPFGRTRLQQAVSRARRLLDRDRTDHLAGQLRALVTELRGPGSVGDRILVRSGGRVVFVDADQIDWIEAEGNYARLHVGAESHLVRETMVNLMTRLGDRFFRIHRSTIVNVERIKELRLAGGGDYDVVLMSGVRLGLSRMYKDALQDRLANARR
jgi:two-component system LytT family response regulator